MNNKIGLGVITCDRQDYLIQCLDAIKANGSRVDYLVVVNDGASFNAEFKAKLKDHYNVHELIEHSPPYKSVGVAKNQAMRRIMINDCDHCFIIENDIIIKDPGVFDAYIKAASTSGIWHMNFALHGPANKLPNTETKNPRQVVDYGNDVHVALYPHCVGAFTYFYKGVIKNVGYHDERLKNAFEHVEHTYQIIKKDLHPPFWWFADIADSERYLTEIPGSIKNSSIPHTKEWHSNFNKAAGWFEIKHGAEPTRIPDTPQEIVFQKLQFLKDTYAKAL
jgi:glycosyltransferase involved in cell wall biosynthesis